MRLSLYDVSHIVCVYVCVPRIIRTSKRGVGDRLLFSEVATASSFFSFLLVSFQSCLLLLDMCNNLIIPLGSFFLFLEWERRLYFTFSVLLFPAMAI